MDSCQLESVVERLNGIFEKTEKHYNQVLEDVKINESTLMNAIDSDLNDLSNRFDAAKRGLGIVNRLSAGQTKLKHTQRVMSNLSRIRTDIANLEKKIKEMLKK